jgi:hypothetical protein
MSWKTTLCGVLVLLGGLVAQFFPEFARYGGFLAALGSGLGFMFARDNNVTSEQAGAKAVPVEDKRQTTLPLNLLLCLAASGAMLSGCASVKTHQTETVYDLDGTVTERTTDFKARTLMDSKNQLSKVRTTMTDKSQGMGIAGLDQESDGSNVVALAKSIAEGATAGAMKALVPKP